MTDGSVEEYFEKRSYPKFQLSKFLDGKRDYQIVIRTESYEELTQSMKDVKVLVEEIGKREEPKRDVYEDQEGRVCRDCGAPQVFNRNTGKWFCSEKCWLKKGSR